VVITTVMVLMRGIMITKMALALVVVSAPLAAFSQETPTIKTEAGPAGCADFRHGLDGSWTPLKDITISTPDGCSMQVEAGRFSFQPAIIAVCGADVGLVLDRQCEGR
jgi:hypothetical protein